MEKIIDELIIRQEEIMNSYEKPDQSKKWAEIKAEVDKAGTLSPEVFNAVCETVALVSEFYETGIVEMEEIDKRYFLKIPITE